MWKKKTLICFVVLLLSLLCSLNSEATIEEGGNITEDTVWTAADVHLVTANIAVGAGITLTIEPGTIVKLNPGKSISINGGILAAAGDASNKIVFTSYRDDEFGGDTNEDGPSQGQPGDWNRIYFNEAVACAHLPCENSDIGTELKNCIVRFGGSGNQGALYMQGSDMSVISSEISESSSYGIYTRDCSPLIEGNTISNNGSYGIYHYKYYVASSPVDRGNTITGNNYGIYVQGAIPTIDGNTITGNTNYGIYYGSADNAPVITGNTITGNTRGVMLPATSVPHTGDGNALAPNSVNGVWIRGNARDSALRFEVLYAGEPHEINTYRITGRMTMNAGHTLTVDPGVVVKFASGAGLDIHGALAAVGTSALPVVFTSDKDDQYGGDLNLDGYGTAPANGDWRGIYFSNQADDASCVIDHAVITYGGSANSGAVYSNQTDFTISNSVISNSSTNGIRTYQASLTLSNNEIFGNTADGMYLQSTGNHTVTGCRVFANFGDGIVVLNSVSANVTAGEIFGNLGYGIRSSSSGAITATGNWWGAANGPGGDGTGSGDQVTSDVSYDPYLTDGTEFSYFNAGPNTSEGLIPGPAVTQGTDTSEWGTDPTTRMLYDLEQVILDYSDVDAGSRFEVFMTYYNPDDTTGIGGNIQRLTDGDDLEIHGSLKIPGVTPTQYHYYLTPSSHNTGALRLNFIRENGYRAVVSQVWVVERADTVDTVAPSSTITSPSPAAQLTGSLAEVIGTSTDGAGTGVMSVEVGIDDGTGTSWYPVTQLREDNGWTYRWSLPADGAYTLYCRARDGAGNLEEPGAGTAVVVNRTAPGPATGLSAFDTPEDTGGSISILWELSADDGAGADDVTGYEIERSEEPAGTFSVVGTVSAGIASFADNTTVDGTQYYYRITTIDLAGNRTASSVYGAVISIINDGSDTTAPEDVTELSGIPGNEFVYLSWTRSVDTAQDLVDQLLDISTDGGSTWGTPLNLGKEAGFYLKDGLTNGTSYRFRVRVKDSSGNISSGTVTDPLLPDPTPPVTPVPCPIDRDTTWPAGVYYVNCNVTVNAGVTLTIQPGVIVKFASGRYMSVLGTLTAVGENGNPVVFTAYTDDSYGGDSNGDGDATTGIPGYWARIYFQDTSSSRLEHVVVRYGGSGNQGNIYMNQSDMSVVSSEISESGSFGIYTRDCSPLIEGNTISNNGSCGIYHYKYYVAGSPVDRGNTITGNNYGIYVQGDTPTIDGNTITGNTNYGIYYGSAGNAPEITNNVITGNAKPVRLPFSSLPGPGAGNTLAPNTKNQIEFLGNTLSRNLVLSADSVNVYYQVGGNVTVATGVKLTVEPGVVWKLAGGSRLDVNGALYAVGTSSEKIVFTSYRDDSFGGDTDGGGFSTGQPGDWNRIYFSDSVLDFLTRLKHVTVRFGGNGNQGALYMFGSDMSVVSSEISESGSFGIYTRDCSPLIEGNTISNNGSCGIYHYKYYVAGSPVDRGNIITGNNYGIYVQGDTPTIDGNTITGNTNYGIYYGSAGNAPVITGNEITGNTRGVMLPATSVPNTGDGNVLAPNSINGVWIRGNARDTDLRFEVLYAEETYEINTYQISGRMTMNAGSTLTVDPGVVVKFASGAGLDVDGALSAAGTSALPVVFTSDKDDQYGGDLNLDGYGTAPANGDWRGIYFSNQADDASCVIDHAVITYGGSANSGAVYSNQTDFTISNSVISNSSTNGIRTYQASLTLSNNEIFGNTADGMYLQSTGNHTVTGCRVFANFGDGIVVLNSVSANVTAGEIFGNLGYGIRSSSSGAITATGNWWGAANGPGGDGTGSGDQVTSDVSYDPYLTDGTEFSYFNAGGTNHYGYGIAQPVVSGIPSTEWGEDPPRSFLYNIDEKRIKAEYIGLSTTSSYRVLVTYLNQDEGGGTQGLTDMNEEIIHPSWALPTSNPMQYAFSIARACIVDGNLILNFNGLSGPRTVVAGIFLMKEVSTDNIPPVVHLNTPISGEILRSEEHFVSGTVSDADEGVWAVEVGIQKAGDVLTWYPVTSINSAGDWSYRWNNPAGGEYTIRARATDHSGNRAIASEVAVVTVDGLAPSPVTGLFAQGLSGISGTMRLIWVLSTDDGAGADDVVRYEVYRSEDWFLTSALVGQVGPGVSQFDDPTVTDGVDYFYHVRTVDHAGNGSDSSVFGPVQSTGSPDTTAPEDVTGLTASVTQVSGANPSVFLTWTGSANTEGDLVDQLLYVSRDGITFGNNNPDYDNGLPYSLGRYARSYQETGLTVGRTYTFKITTIDEVPHESSGAMATATPTGAESETVTLGGTLPADTSLKSGVYYVSSNLTIPVGATLTLGPGAILKFASGRYISVLGTLTAVGENGNPIVFTAYTDDYGGDSNGDRDATTGTPGYWARIYFQDTSSSRLEHVVVRYGGSGNQGNIYMNRSDMSVVSSEISESGSFGIYTRDCSPLIEGNTISNNGSYGIYHYKYYVAGSPVDRGNTITGNNYGIYVQGAIPTIDGNTITGNTNYGIYYGSADNAPEITNNIITGNLIPILVPASSLPDETNVLTPNTRKYIGIRGNDIRSDKRLRIWGKGTPDEISTYVVYSGDITIPIYTFMTIDPGVALKSASGVDLIVRGALIANGTADAEIIFTSFKDDTYGGDTNDDASNSTPANGDWRGITFYDSFFEGSSHLNHVKVRYAGANNSGALYFNQADVLVENSEISNSATNGIRVYSASPTLTGNRIWGNSGDGVRVEQNSNAEITFNRISTNLSDGIEILGNSSATATNNQIFMNREYGVLNQTANPVDATHTWWGDSDAGGPYHATTNPDGAGDRVSDNVNYDPFQTTVALEFSYRNFSENAGSTFGSMPPPDLIQGTLSDEWDPSDKRPDRTMAWDEYTVILDYTGLESTERYKIRVSYFNGDPGGSIQSLTDGNDNPIHGSMVMPTSAPVQFEFSIPSSFYADGNIRLKFVHDNPETSIRAAVPDLWMMEDILEISPPRFEAVEYNDVDGSGSLTEGDEFYFHFSEEMDTFLLVDGTTDANNRLVPEGDRIYGTVNQSRWTADEKTVIVTLTEGFTVTGSETVTPNGLTDLFGNVAIGSQNLTTTDTIAPKFTGVDWVDADVSGSVSLGDEYVFYFNETMNVSVIQDATQDANIHLRPSGGLRYGDVNTLSWSPDGRGLAVTVTEGFTILGDELVIPSGFVTDVAGNRVTGSHQLLGRDIDGDGMPDCWEIDNFGDLATADENTDYDGDGLLDKDEYFQGTDPKDPDSDDDGLTDGDEVHVYHTDPNNPDSDGDGYDDGEEVAAGTDPLSEYSYPAETAISLRKGFNLIAIPADVSTQSDLKDWLPVLGDNTEIEKVLVYDAQAGKFITLILGDASNPSFMLKGGEGLIVYAKQDKEITFTTVLRSTLDLNPGFNLIGFACPDDGYSAYQLLTDLGSENISSIQRYSTEKGTFETAGFTQDGQHVGVDFTIVPGEGYFVFMKQEVLGF